MIHQVQRSNLSASAQLVSDSRTAIPSIAVATNERWATDCVTYGAAEMARAAIALVIGCCSLELLGLPLLRSGKSRAAKPAARAGVDRTFRHAGTRAALVPASLGQRPRFYQAQLDRTDAPSRLSLGVQYVQHAG